MSRSEAPPDANGGLVHGTVAVDFAGLEAARLPISQPFAVAAGSSAWDAIRQSLGESRVAYEDFGGDLGILISGFDGLKVTGNRFWSFSVNGVSSEVGVSGYKVQEGDLLQFKVETF